MKSLRMYVYFLGKHGKTTYRSNNIPKKDKSRLLISLEQLSDGVFKQTPGQFGIRLKLFNLSFVMINGSRFRARPF